MTGKLGQSLRKYNEQKGQPDFELEKFAINSLLAASHTSEMDPNDQEDIIKKVKTAGNDSEPDSSEDQPEPSMDEPMDADGAETAPEPAPEEGLEESIDNLFVNPKKNNMFQPGSNDKLNESCWKGYKQVGMKDKDGKQVPNCVPIDENIDKNLVSKGKNSIFDRNYLEMKLHETFQDDTVVEPQVQPAPTIAPTTEPSKPSRKNKPFLPMPNVQPKPKALKENSTKGPKIYHDTLSQTLDTVKEFAKARGYDEPQFDMNDVQHVAYGNTERFSKELTKNGMPQRKTLNAQIYRMDGGNYELNVYIA